MIVVTSISPGHKNAENQQRAIDSWQQYGKCYSLNCEEEVKVLNGNYSGIEFVETHRTSNHYVGKNMVSVNAIFDFAKGLKEDLLLINSDIVLRELPILKEDGMTIFSRYDYTEDMDDNKMFVHGFDVFFIPHNILHIFPPSIYGVGIPWHDFVWPFHCILNNIPVYYPKGIYAFHKLHPTQYAVDEWLYIGEHFRLDFRLDKNLTIPQIATQSMERIKQNLKYE